MWIPLVDRVVGGALVLYHLMLRARIDGAAEPRRASARIAPDLRRIEG
ncbi:MAG: hypothetical protein ACTHU0_24165 [Kofleriaceae bacterium]